MKGIVYTSNGNNVREIPDEFIQNRNWAAYEEGIGEKLFAIRFLQTGDELVWNVRREGDAFVDVNPDEES